MTWDAFHQSGRLLGQKISVSGPENGSARFWRMPSGLFVQAEDSAPVLEAWIEYVEPENTIDLIAHSSATHFQSLRKKQSDDPNRFQPFLRDHQFLTIINLLLSKPREWTKGRRLNSEGLRYLTSLLINAMCDIDKREPPEWDMVQRMAFQQAWPQEGYNSWSRVILMQSEITKLLKPSDQFDLDGYFKQLCGVPFNTFVFMCFGLFSVTAGQPGKTFGPQQFATTTDFELAPTQVQDFFDLISISFDDYGDRYFAPGIFQKGFDFYNLSPLLRWPALRRPSGAHIVPVPRLILDRASTGIYFDYIMGLSSKDASRFGNFWGASFESYIGELLRPIPGFAQIERAERFVKSGPMCDWIVDDGETLLLIECKTRSVSAKSRVTGLKADLQRDVSSDTKGGSAGSSLGRGVYQLMRTRDKLVEKFGKTRNYVCMLVTLDSIYAANLDEWLHGFIREAAEKHYGTSLPEDFVVTDVNGLEHFAQLVLTTGASPCDLLRRKAASAEFRPADLSIFVSEIAPPNLSSLDYLKSVSDISMAELVKEFTKPK